MSILLEEYKEYEVEKTKEYYGTPIDVLIDGDIPAYRSSAATDGKMYRVVVPKIIDEYFKYHKQATEFADKHHGALISVEYKPEPISHAIHNVDKSIRSILQEVADYYERPVIPFVFITGKANFRDVINPDYKASRRTARRPANLSHCKKHLVDHWDGEFVEGYEADDLLCIESYHRQHRNCIIVSLDKDLLQIPGTHYDFVKKKFSFISKAEARHLFWKQVLTGDKVDDIEGIHGVGPVTAATYLSDLSMCGTNFDYYQKILGIYMSKFPKEEEESLREYYTRVVGRVSKTARQLYLCREYEKPWDIPEQKDPIPQLSTYKYDAELFRQIMININTGHKVKAVKLVHSYTGLGLRKAKMLVEDVERKIFVPTL